MNNHKVASLLGAVQDATRGEVEGFEDDYIQDVKNRIPEIERALHKLKNYLGEE